MGLFIGRQVQVIGKLETRSSWPFRGQNRFELALKKVSFNWKTIWLGIKRDGQRLAFVFFSIIKSVFLVPQFPHIPGRKHVYITLITGGRIIRNASHFLRAMLSDEKKNKQTKTVLYKAWNSSIALNILGKLLHSSPPTS